MHRMSCLLICGLAIVGCQNWDLLRPEADGASEERAFTRLDGGATEPLTNDVALRRYRQIQAASGADRLSLIDRFYSQFPSGRMIPEIHALAGEAHLANDDPGAAADSFERALVLMRTDLLGMPLDTTLPIQLGMARLTAGDRESGEHWLVRTSVVDRSPGLDQALRWAFSERSATEGDFDAWLATARADVAVRAPGFELPGLQESSLDLDAIRGGATLVNFWSPT